MKIKNKIKTGLAMSIELLVVIVVITILIVMAVGGIAYLISGSKILKITKEVSDVREAITSYQINHNGKMPGVTGTDDSITQIGGNERAWVALNNFSALSSYPIAATGSIPTASNYQVYVDEGFVPRSNYDDSYIWVMVSDNSTLGLMDQTNVQTVWNNKIPRIALVRFSNIAADSTVKFDRAKDVASLSRSEAGKIGQKLSSSTQPVTNNYIIEDGSPTATCINATTVSNSISQIDFDNATNMDAVACVMQFRATNYK